MLCVFVPEYAEYKEQKVRRLCCHHRGLVLMRCVCFSGIRQLAEECQGLRRRMSYQAMLPAAIQL